MREALTVIGFLIIVAFSALLAAPLFVDWNDWRETVAQRMANAIGAAVLIEGPIEAHILPQPWLSVSGLRIGEPGGSTVLSIEKAEADLSLSALFKGDTVLSNVVLERPKLSIAAGEGGAIAPLVIAPGDRAVSIESFQISNGSLFYRDDAASVRFEVDEVGLVGDARALTGPFKAEGGAMIEGRRQSINLSSGAASAEGLRIKLAVIPADEPVSFDFEGLAKAGPEGPSFEGTSTMARLPAALRGEKETNGKDAKSIPIEKPWKIVSKVALTPSEAKAETINIQIGPDESPVKLTGDGVMTFGTSPTLTARLAATQIDFDRLAGVQPDKRIAPLAVIDRLRLATPDIVLPQIPMTIDLKADGALLGGLALTGLSADLASTSKGWQVKSLVAGLPGRTKFNFNGEIAATGQGAVSGRLDIDARQASTLLAWIEGANRPAAPNAAQRLAITGALSAGEDGLAFSDLKLAIDDATAEGRFALRPASQGQTGRRLEADLTANRLDIDAFPSIAALMPGGGAIVEADVKLSARSITYGGIEAKTAAGHVTFEGDALAIQDVAIDDFGGASLSANGTIEGLSTTPTGSIAIRVDARDLSPVATALKRSALPKVFVEAFERRAASFSPAGGTVALSFGDTRRLTIDGRFGGSTVETTLDLAGDPGAETIDASVKLDSLDAVRLVRQLGFTPLPLTIAGRASFALEIEGALASSRRWAARYEGGGLSVGGSGKLVGPFDAPAIDGRLKIGAPDVTAVAQLFGVPLAGVLPGEGLTLDTGFRAKDGKVAFDDLTGLVMGSPVTGALSFEPTTPVGVNGRLALGSFDLDRLLSLVSGTDLTAGGAAGLWPEEAFGPAPGATATGKVALTIDKLGLGSLLPAATNAKAVVDLLPTSTGIEGIAATVATGALTGDVALARGGTDVAFTGKLALKGAVINTGAVSGKLDTALEFQGTGRTPSAVAGSLTGGGTLTLAGASLPQTAPDAFAKVVAAIDAAPDATKVDIDQTLRQALDAGPLPLGDIGGSIALANGQLRLGTTPIAGAPVKTSLSGAIDLIAMTAKADVVIAPAPPGDGFGGSPPDFKLKIVANGEGLSRGMDAFALAGWATTRAAEREAKKLEALEAERVAREAKAEEEKRLEAERMRRAIEAAKKAEEERKAAEDAAKAQKIAPLLEAPVTPPLPTAPDPVPAAPTDQPPAGTAPKDAAPSTADPVKVSPIKVVPITPAPGSTSAQTGDPVTDPVSPAVAPASGERGLAPSETGGAILDPEPLPTGATPTGSDPTTTTPAIAADETPPLPPLPPPIEIRRAPEIRILQPPRSIENF